MNGSDCSFSLNRQMDNESGWFPLSCLSKYDGYCSRGGKYPIHILVSRWPHTIRGHTCMEDTSRSLDMGLSPRLGVAGVKFVTRTDEKRRLPRRFDASVLVCSAVWFLLLGIHHHGSQSRKEINKLISSVSGLKNPVKTRHSGVFFNNACHNSTNLNTCLAWSFPEKSTKMLK